MKRSRLLWELVRIEGLRSLFERLRERVEEQAWRRSFRRVSLESLISQISTAPALQIFPSTWRARRGGTPQALLARFEALARIAPVVVVANEGMNWTIFFASGHGGRYTADLPLCRPIPRNHKLERPLEELFNKLPGHLPLHLEHPGGLSFPWLAQLAQSRPIVGTIHDYAYFCPRVDLLEAPSLRPCGGSRDEDRCRACRVAGGIKDPEPLAERRKIAQLLLDSAAGIVYPSAASREAIRGLFPEVRPQLERVIPPALEFAQAALRPACWPPRRIAFVGEAVPRKGFPEFLELARELTHLMPKIQISSLGGGDPQLLSRAQELGIRVLGYYRYRTLPARLAEHAIDFAILPSRFSETHCLALDGCHQAGVPTAATAVGALKERATWHLPAEPGSWARSLESYWNREDPPPQPPKLPSPKESAQAHFELWLAARSWWQDQGRLKNV